MAKVKNENVTYKITKYFNIKTINTFINSLKKNHLKIYQIHILYIEHHMSRKQTTTTKEKKMQP